MTVPAPLRKRIESLLTQSARALSPVVDTLARPLPSRSVTPKWSASPLLTAATRDHAPRGWPRTTDSLCPTCAREARDSVVRGDLSIGELIAQNPGVITAHIEERDGKVIMWKECAKHGRFEDTLSVDPEFLQVIERRAHGRDFRSTESPLRNHGVSTIKYGRGSVLTIDLTNRCNMMCDPCFMDANQVGFVHELDFPAIKKLLDDSLTIQPIRQMSVQFSGGEPTLSPHFLEAIAYARAVGYFCVQCASNGIRFAQDPSYCQAAKRAGLRLVYLQFDGASNESHRHRKVGNLFDVKQRAIDHLAAAGIDVVLVATVVNGVNNDQVGPILRFAVENADKVTVVSFQPVSFTGRDEDISDEDRMAQRYTLSHLAHDVQSQLGATEPLRDWFPLSAMNPFSDLMDLLQGPAAAMGALKCGCHPHCGIGTVFLVHKESGEMVPLSQFVDVERLLRDVEKIADAGHGRKLTLARVALATLRAFRPEHAPAGYSLGEFFRQLLSQSGAQGERVGETEGDAGKFPWRFLFVAGMWFQDLWTYDFRRTEQCIIPYATQLGEISFCAYNTGIGWRHIVESLHQTSNLRDWYAEHGKHTVYAKLQAVPLPEPRRRLPIAAE